jgi:hypothetical protein
MYIFHNILREFSWFTIGVRPSDTNRAILVCGDLKRSLPKVTRIELYFQSPAMTNRQDHLVRRDLDPNAMLEEMFAQPIGLCGFETGSCCRPTHFLHQSAGSAYHEPGRLISFQARAAGTIVLQSMMRFMI